MVNVSDHSPKGSHTKVCYSVTRRMNFLIMLFIASLGIIFKTHVVFAAPAISGASGVLVEGQTITIRGSGFGEKTVAAPVKWDNFENGSIGSNITANGWINYSGGNTGPVFGNGKVYSGSKSAMRNITAYTEDFNGAYLTFKNNPAEAYASLYFYWETANGSTPPNGGVFKWLRLNTRSVYHGVPSWVQQFQPSGSWFYEFYNANGTLHQYTMNNAPKPNQWNRLEVYWKLSNPGGASNGQSLSWVNLTQNFNATNAITRASGDTATIYSFLLPLMASQAGTNYRFYVDDVYVDTTIARVEIGNAATWTSCTKREIQIPSSWSTTSINVTVNKGSFARLEGMYLYVVDANGAVNSNGYQLSGSAPDPISPSPPTNLISK